MIWFLIIAGVCVAVLGAFVSYAILCLLLWAAIKIAEWIKKRKGKHGKKNLPRIPRK